MSSTCYDSQSLTVDGYLFDGCEPKILLLWPAMADVKRACFWAVICVIAGVVVFVLNRLYGPVTAYSIFLAPGNLLLGLFTEEINFWPKLCMLMSFQFLVSFAAIYVFLKTVRRFMHQ